MIHNPALIGAVLLIAAVDWMAVWRGWRGIEYFAKPATMVALFIWVYSAGQLDGPLFWVGIGILMSLLGDIFLMLPADRFIPGLVAFLMAHVAYIIAINTPLPFITLPMIGVAIVVGIGALRLLQRIRAGLETKGLHRLVGPVRLYANVITLMLLSALLTIFRPEWNSLPAYLVSLGALLFFISDVILAWHRFINPVRFGRVANMVTYHLGQVGLVVGAVAQFVNP